uniref:Uncharacterized protein n=1 Tax=Rhizophora mucronata TaxID=61149 RepID=A0A2P2II96_RHIMU
MAKNEKFDLLRSQNTQLKYPSATKHGFFRSLITKVIEQNQSWLHEQHFTHNNLISTSFFSVSFSHWYCK